MTDTLADSGSPLTMAATVARRAGDDAVALRWRHQQWSWAEVVQAGAVRAAVTTELLGPGPGLGREAAHIAVLLDNVPEYIWWLGAAAMSGAVIIGANPTHRGQDLARDLAHTGCRMLVTDSAHLHLVDGLHIGESIGTVSATNPHVLLVDRPAYEAQLERLSGAALPDFGVVGEDELGYLIFTSGTSGAPKACRCTQGRLARIGAIVGQMFALGPGDCCYIAMPLFHSNALMAGWGPAVASGACVALPDEGRFSASGFLPEVRRHGATYFNYVGKPLSYILATPEHPDDGDNPLRTIFGNEGAEADVARFGSRFRCTVIDSYGSTEGGATVTRTPDTPPGALGRAPEGTIVIDPETGGECPRAAFDDQRRLLNAAQCIGELVSTTGAAGFEGYWQNDEAERTRLRNGWYFTGDLAYRDDDGFFYFAGRADDWLRVDGENFAAAPVARILERHHGVRLAVVYAVPDAAVGDQVMAALEMHDGAIFEPDEFAAFLARQPDMGTKWPPRFVRICDHLPMTATSKVMTRTLRAQRWHSPDPMWWTPLGRPGSSYVEFTYADAEDLDGALDVR